MGSPDVLTGGCGETEPPTGLRELYLGLTPLGLFVYMWVWAPGTPPPTGEAKCWGNPGVLLVLASCGRVAMLCGATAES